MIVALTTNIPAKTNAGWVWFPLEVQEANSIDDIWETLKAHGAIKGAKIDASLRPNGVRVITKRTPIIVGASGVVTITTLHVEVVDG